MVHRWVGEGLVHLLLWLMGRRRRYRITGGSMRPILSPGDQILVDPLAYTETGPKVGDIVVARHLYRTDVWMVKRVVGVLDDGRCFLAGDNPDESTDSRLFGAVPRSLILGRVVFCLPRRKEPFNPPTSPLSWRRSDGGWLGRPPDRRRGRSGF